MIDAQHVLSILFILCCTAFDFISAFWQFYHSVTAGCSTEGILITIVSLRCDFEACYSTSARSPTAPTVACANAMLKLPNELTVFTNRRFKNNTAVKFSHLIAFQAMFVPFQIRRNMFSSDPSSSKSAPR